MSLRNVFAIAVMGTSATAAFGQLPAIPAAPAVPAIPAVPGAGVPGVGGGVPGVGGGVPGVGSVPTAAPRNIWSFFMLTPDQKASCAAKKDKLCQSQFGKLLNNVVKPASAITGGILPGCCPPSATDPLAPNPADLNKPATEAEGAAARIKQLEAGAADRKAAVRYLGTVNCKRFPEAETALIGALRTDTNECVRYEAAMAFARGCCCSTKTIKALTLTVDGSDKDGNPPETSLRVRAMAAQALARCCGTVTEPPKEPPAELPPEKPTPEATAQRIEAIEREKSLVDGRKALSDYIGETPSPALTTGRRTVADTIRFAAATAPISIPQVPTSVASVPTPPATIPAPMILPAAATIPVPTSAVAPSKPTTTPVNGLPPTGRRGLFDLMSSSHNPSR
ncbi:hypothetical protein [Limnoglobus roseus]|uniref:HEAT repeat domain-containing protein n=1 Tax=Limnoglobus roseus TaxID=2598579 RepID=A0A5C1AJR8_9BACT|nr:hypothetical protein [Limnoglobus roseus]QEL19451.1 hypothetical protein PX52LOC_06523 [Limnoglobus roseus]